MTTVRNISNSLIQKVRLYDFEFGKMMMEIKNGITAYKWYGVNRLAAFRSSPNYGWIVVVNVTYDERMASVREIKNWNLALGTVIIFLATLILSLIIRSAVSSILRHNNPIQ